MNNVEPKSAVVYARFSSHKQGEQSIEGQLEAAYKYAAENGYTIIREYTDRAMTGRNDNRDAFQQMLKDTAKGEFSTIIVWKVDRFGRNREEIAFNKYRCKKNNVKVVYIAEAIPDSPEGVILESVLEGMAEYYSLQLAANVRRGMKLNAEKCKSTGGTIPLGYKVNPKTKIFEIDENTAPIVRLIFKMYSEGKITTEIIRELNERGYRNNKGKPFRKNSLNTILKNEKYIGIYKYNNDIRIENGVPAIVDEEVFNKVREMLKFNQKRAAKKGVKAEYLLTNKLFCGYCGSKMVGESGTSSKGTTYNYYICSKRKREKSCKKKTVRQDYIEDAVIKDIQTILNDDELLKEIADAVYEYSRRDNENEKQIKILKKSLSEINVSLSNVMKAIEAGAVTPTTTARLAELEEQKAAVESELNSNAAAEKLKLTTEQILFFFHKLRDMDISKPETKKQLVNTFVNAIYLYDDHFDIAYNHNPNNTEQITLENLKDLEQKVRTENIEVHQNNRIRTFYVCKNVFMRRVVGS